MATVGVHRPARLAKYLPAHGITPAVLTLDRDSVAQWSGRQADDTLLEVLPPNLVIHRVPCPRPPQPVSRWQRRLQHFFSSGDAAGRHWQARLGASWDRVVGDTKPDAVLVTAPPFSIVPPVSALARRSGLPLVVDFRDAWSQWSHNANPTWWHYQAKLRAERQAVEKAAAVVGVTDQLLTDLRRVHPHVDPAKFFVVPSGYEPGATKDREARQHRQTRRSFVIGYVGSFYYSPGMRASVMEPWWRKSVKHWPQYTPRREDWLYRSPYFFFRALARLIARRPELRQIIRVRFAGDRQPWLEQQAAEFGLQQVVEQVGRLSHAECLEFEADSDALLVTSMKVIGGRDYCIAGKTFEYIASGRPILGIVTDGEQRDFLVESGAAVVADPDDVEASADAIERIVAKNFVPGTSPVFLNRFSAMHTSGQLADVVRAVRRNRA